MNRRTLLVAAVCIAIAAFVLPRILRTERSRVLAAFHAAAENLEKSGPETLLAASLKAKALGELVDGTLTLALSELEVEDVFDAMEVQRYAAYARNRMTTLHVEFRDIRVEFPAGGEAAATAVLLATGDLENSIGRETSAVAARLRKDPDTGKWRFHEVRVDPVLAQ